MGGLTVSSNYPHAEVKMAQIIYHCGNDVAANTHLKLELAGSYYP